MKNRLFHSSVSGTWRCRVCFLFTRLHVKLLFVNVDLYETRLSPSSRRRVWSFCFFFSKKTVCVRSVIFFSLPPLSLPLFFIFFTLCFSRNRIVLSIFQLLYVYVFFFFFFSFHGYRKCCYRWIYCEQTEMESTDASLVFFFFTLLIGPSSHCYLWGCCVGVAVSMVEQVCLFRSCFDIPLTCNYVSEIPVFTFWTNQAWPCTNAWKVENSCLNFTSERVLCEN